MEDGSTQRCDHIVSNFKTTLEITYYFKENSGQGFSRNYGYERAKGDFFISLDSDCLVPPQYLFKVEEHLHKDRLDAFGGPDCAHSSFTPIQKAISYAMTSLYTTGGMRGDKRQKGTFHPRSFNMGISKEVYKKTQGYILPRMAEDIEFSMRIHKAGFKTGLIPEAYVYHKRRTSFGQFYKQLHFFGRGRINIHRYYPEEVKAFHAMPAAFTLFILALPLLWICDRRLLKIGLGLLATYASLIFIDAFFKNKNARVAALSVAASFVQLFAYGHGFLQEAIQRIKEIRMENRK